MSTPQAYVVMGVSGCGKSSVARLLAENLGAVFRDGDDFHPPANKAKMASGIPLTDEDRWGWLDVLNGELRRITGTGQTVFLACSALRQVYRERLAVGLSDLHFIYLKGAKELLLQRLESRMNHFMPAKLLDSQLATLEEPSDALVVSIEDPLPVLVSQVMNQIQSRNGDRVSHLIR